MVSKNITAIKEEEKLLKQKLQKKWIYNKFDIILPLILGVIFSGLYAGVKVIISKYFTSSLEVINTKVSPELAHIYPNISDIVVTFGITFAAFSVTALSLLLIVHDKEWYSTFKDSTHHDNIISNYRLLIVINMFMVIFGTFGKLLLPQHCENTVYIYNLVAIFMLVFTSSFTVLNIKVLIDILFMRAGNIGEEESK